MPEAQRRAQLKYRTTDKYKESRRRYRESAKGRAAARAYIRYSKSGTRFMVQAAKAQPCTDCGGRFPCDAMEYDHRDSSTKAGNVANLTLNKYPSAVFAEIAKCDLVCANCHRVRTFNRRYDAKTHQG